MNGKEKKPYEHNKRTKIFWKKEKKKKASLQKNRKKRQTKTGAKHRQVCC
jgi:hypothetical protein